MREAYQSHIAPIVADRWATQKSDGSNVQTAKDPSGPFRAAIARELFAALPKEDRDGFGQRAKEEATEARRIYDEGLKSTPSRSPEAKQK
jgi:hypothetical protein